MNIGEKYGRLTVLSLLEERGKGGHTMCECRCDCGNIIIRRRSGLTSGGVKSCGCLKMDSATKHGGSRDRLYKVWEHIIERCYRPDLKSYKDYGGRGISVCDEWLNDYNAFKKWALESGYDENAEYGVCTIDRINYDGNYEPSNCRWISMAEQNRNKRNNVLIYIDGETHHIEEWCRIYNLPKSRVHNRRFRKNPIRDWFKEIDIKEIRLVNERALH